MRRCEFLWTEDGLWHRPFQVFGSPGVNPEGPTARLRIAQQSRRMRVNGWTFRTLHHGTYWYLRSGGYKGIYRIVEAP